MRSFSKQLLLTLSPLLLAIVYSADLLAQTPSIELKTARDFVYSSGDDALQSFIVTIANPTNEDLRNVDFTITMDAGVVLGSVDSECTENETGFSRTLSCLVDYVGPQNIVVIDFFVDGPLSSVPDGFLSMELSSDLTSLEQTDFERSLADGNRTVFGKSLSLPFVRDILHDANNNTIADINEIILQPQPTQSWEEILAEEAILDVLFLVSATASDYLEGQLEQRIDQLITATNETYRENGVYISIASLGVESIDYSADEALEDTLAKMQTGSDAAFIDLQDRINDSGADMLVLLHALQSATDTFCGFSTNVAIGRQGDFIAELHRGDLLTVIDVGPSCIDLPDLAASLATNMGVVPSRLSNPDGGTFSYSAGYGVTDGFRTIATRVGGQDFGTALDVNRFSNPAFLCVNANCGVDENDISLGANAVLSLNQTRHVVDALNDSGIDNPVATKRAITSSNGLDLSVSHTTVEAGVLMGAFAEFQIGLTNNTSETLHDINVTAIHLNDGFLNFEAANYLVDGEQCLVSGATLTTEQTSVDSQIEKAGRLSCFVDAIAPGEEVQLEYAIEVATTAPELDEENHYLHEIIALNGLLQEESARCIPVYTDLVDAATASGVCTVVDQLTIASETGAGFLDLTELPTITGNMISVPFLRLNDSSLISAQFQVVNFGTPELVLVSYQVIEANLAPLSESSFDENTGVLSINGISLAEALYNASFMLRPDTDPVLFDQMLLTVVEEEE